MVAFKERLRQDTGSDGYAVSMKYFSPQTPTLTQNLGLVF